MNKSLASDDFEQSVDVCFVEFFCAEFLFDEAANGDDGVADLNSEFDFGFVVAQVFEFAADVQHFLEQHRSFRFVERFVDYFEHSNELGRCEVGLLYFVNLGLDLLEILLLVVKLLVDLVNNFLNVEFLVLGLKN